MKNIYILAAIGSLIGFVYGVSLNNALACGAFALSLCMSISSLFTEIRLVLVNHLHQITAMKLIEFMKELGHDQVELDDGIIIGYREIPVEEDDDE